MQNTRTDLVHQQLDDHDDSLQPLDDLQHFLLIDARLLQENDPNRVNLEDDLFEPKFIRLVGDDEKMFIMDLSPVYLGLGLLGMEELVKLQVVSIRDSS